MPPSPLTPGAKNKYPDEKVRQYMDDIATAGFGTIVEESKAGSNTSLQFLRSIRLINLGKVRSKPRN